MNSFIINFVETSSSDAFESQFSQELESTFRDPRINRSFESLITERNGNQEENDKSLYSHVFKQIKNKIFSINEINTIPQLSQEQIESFEKKYYTSDLSNSINRVKKLLVNNFNKKIELEIKIEDRKSQFEEFSKNIANSLKSIETFSDNSPQDENLKNLLSERIDWYYSKLELDSLKKEYSESLSEYSFFKNLLRSINDISPCGICQICMENQVGYFIDPCGHAICYSCNGKTKSPLCPFCRIHISSYKKMYL
jgi:hypothetical protein